MATQKENLHRRLRKAEWVAFDLDDTLHEFRKASGAAVHATLQLIIDQHNATQELTVADLKDEYRRILKQKTSGAFVDGKTSHQYRAERLQLVMQAFQVKAEEGQMQSLLDCYESTLTANLELKHGAMDLVRKLKGMDKKIAIITEGPQDAQERTVEALGLTSYIDYLATTNKLGVAKVDGLFHRVLKVLDVSEEEVVMVGDSYERDILPAREAGIVCVWFAEEKGSVSDQGERNEGEDSGVFKVNTLAEVGDLVEGL